MSTESSEDEEGLFFVEVLSGKGGGSSFGGGGGCWGGANAVVRVRTHDTSYDSGHVSRRYVRLPHGRERHAADI